MFVIRVILGSIWTVHSRDGVVALSVECIGMLTCAQNIAKPHGPADGRIPSPDRGRVLRSWSSGPGIPNRPFEG
jgi:hypothetical protein